MHRESSESVEGIRYGVVQCGFFLFRTLIVGIVRVVFTQNVLIQTGTEMGHLSCVDN